MTPEMIQQLRDQIAAEIAEKFGNLAPYTLVQNFVRTGPQKGTTDAERPTTTKAR